MHNSNGRGSLLTVDNVCARHFFPKIFPFHVSCLFEFSNFLSNFKLTEKLLQLKLD